MTPLVLFVLLAQGAGEATISGKVTDAVTHQAVPEANVFYCCPDAVTFTDTDGAFALTVKEGAAGISIRVSLKTTSSRTTQFAAAPEPHLR